jgi:Tol biopolymer transport system component
VALHPHEGEGGGDIRVVDLVRETNPRLTSSGHNNSPVWAQDGLRVAFSSNYLPGGPVPNPEQMYTSNYNLYERRADATGETNILLDSAKAGLPLDWKQPTSWSTDGRLAFEVLDTKTSFDLYVIDLSGDRSPKPLIRTEFQELQAQFSPDNRFVAYSSNKSGRGREVYVRPSRDAIGEWPISTTGGSYPRWRQDGRELFYISADRKLMVVPISTVGSDLQPGLPNPLFDVRVPNLFFPPDPITATGTASYPYAVSGDGQRFLVAVDQTQAAAGPPITVVVNWPARLRK